MSIDVAAIRTACLENASYREDNSPAKANAFVTACRRLIIALPSKATSADGASVEQELIVYRQLLADAELWLSSHGDQPPRSGGVRFPDFGGFRS